MSPEITLGLAYADLRRNLDNWFETETLMLNNKSAENLTREEYHKMFLEGGWFSSNAEREQRKKDAEFSRTLYGSLMDG